MTTTLLIILSIGILLAFILILYLVSSWISKKYFGITENEFSTQPNKFVIFLVLLCVILLLASGILPFIFTREIITTDFDFKETGPIGDTIGGIMGPFINIVAVLVTGLAFYMQYRANKLQVSLFNKQMKESSDQFKTEQGLQELQIRKTQFESQFFELLRLHKENVNELSSNNFYQGADKSDKGHMFYKIVEGRQVFFIMNEIFTELLGYTIRLEDEKLTEKNFKDAYNVFFWGSKQNNKVESDFSNILNGSSFIKLNSYRIVSKFKTYNGVSFYLGHYFRHLFLTVKFVEESKVITEYEEKMKYLKILRAQLSNYEQIMLFYNWLSGYGGAWEDGDNHFFTEYKMIHNLWTEELFKEEYIVNNVNKLIEIYNKKNTGKKPLFEFQGKDFEKKMEIIKKETNGE